MGVEADAPACDSIRIAERQNLPNEFATQPARSVTIIQQGPNRTLARPRTAGFPTVLPEHQPDGLFSVGSAARNGPQQKIAAAHRLSNHLLMKIRMASN